MEPRLASSSKSVLVHWMGVSDTNSAGTVHGGTVLKLADEAAGLAAMRHAGRRVVTAGLDRVTFVLPIAKGELVTFSAYVNAVWRTSMEVGVRVTAENPREHGAPPRHTHSAYFTMVAIDEGGRPTPVPPLRCSDEDEHRREREAQVRRRNRLSERSDLLEQREREGE